MILDSWTEHNGKVLRGEVKGRTMPIQEYGSDDFPLLENVLLENHFDRMVEMSRSFPKYYPGCKKGLLLYGSLVKGSFSRASDIDVSLVIDSQSQRFSPEVEFAPHGIHYGVSLHTMDELTADKALDLILADKMTVDEFNRLWNENKNFQGENFEIINNLKFLLISIPLGSEMIELQAMVLEKIRSLPEDKQNKIWTFLSLVILEAETKSLGKTEGGYSIIGKPLTFKQFESRWKNRIDWSNGFCARYNMLFD